MSDQDLGKKMVEETELEYFLEAYEWTTGRQLTVVEAGENPDFLCARGDKVVGIELTKVMRDRDYVRWKRIVEREGTTDPYGVFLEIQMTMERKERARRDRYVNRVKNTILVLQLVDGALSVLRHILERSIELPQHGFEEVWIADYSGLEGFGDIELFGLFPEDLQGYSRRPWPDRKPFG